MFQSTRPARGATVAVPDKDMRHRCFNPRAPRGARPYILAMRKFEEFQSTRPARGATDVRGQRHRPDGVSIHAPRAGRDTVPLLPDGRNKLFQSTRPARGATKSSI